MLDPHRAYYQRQIEAATGQPLRAIQRELDRLTSVGLLYRHTEGNRTYHQVDVQFPLFPELRSMVLKTVEPEERLRGLLACDEAVRLARKGLELAPTSEYAPLGHYVLADVYNRQGRTLDAAREAGLGRALEAKTSPSRRR